MYVLNDASKMVIQYNSSQQIEMTGTSGFGLPTRLKKNIGLVARKRTTIKFYFHKLKSALRALFIKKDR